MMGDARRKRAAGKPPREPHDPPTVEDILAAHAQFGPLDKAMTKKAMGPNWPAAWDRVPPGTFIFQGAR